MARGRIAVLVMALAVFIGLPACHPTPPSQVCGFTLALSNSSFTSSGGSGTAAVSPVANNASDCSWSAQKDSSWLTLTGTTSGTASSGSFGYSAAANTTTSPLPGKITVSFSSPTTGTSGSDPRTVTVAGLDALSPVFVAQSTTGLKDDNCFVNVTDSKVKCTFNASGSTPAALITSYTFSIDATKDQLGSISSTPTVTDPIVQNCGTFMKDIQGAAGGVFPTTVTLTVKSSDGRSASYPRSITFTTNAKC
jgi:hypothetical protein